MNEITLSLHKNIFLVFAIFVNNFFDMDDISLLDLHFYDKIFENSFYLLIFNHIFHFKRLFLFFI